MYCTVAFLTKIQNNSKNMHWFRKILKNLFILIQILILLLYCLNSKFVSMMFISLLLLVVDWNLKNCHLRCSHDNYANNYEYYYLTGTALLVKDLRIIPIVQWTQLKIFAEFSFWLVRFNWDRPILIKSSTIYLPHNTKYKRNN